MSERERTGLEALLRKTAELTDVEQEAALIFAGGMEAQKLLDESRERARQAEAAQERPA